MHIAAISVAEGAPASTDLADVPPCGGELLYRGRDRRSTPEDGSRVVVDLVEECVDAAGVAVVVAVPATVAAGPIESPETGVGLVARLGNGEAGLVVLTRRVVDTADGWAADGGVASVMVVGVEPVVQRCGAFGV